MAKLVAADGVIAVQALWRPLLTPSAEAQPKALVQFRGAIGPKVVIVKFLKLNSELCGRPGKLDTVILLTAETQQKL